MDLKKIQRIAPKIIVKEKYQNYENALNILELDTLKDRREKICLAFAQKVLKNKTMKHFFPPNTNKNYMKTRDPKHIEVFHANTERYLKKKTNHLHAEPIKYKNKKKDEARKDMEYFNS